MDAHTQLLLNSIKTAERTQNTQALQELQAAVKTHKGERAWTVLVTKARSELAGENRS